MDGVALVNLDALSEVFADVDSLVGDGVSRDLALNGSFNQGFVSAPYDANNPTDRATGLWSPPLFSPDAEIIPNKGALDAKVRDSIRNDGYVQAGQQLHKDSIVGAQYNLNASPNIAVLGLDETWATEMQEEVENKFQLAAESDSHWFDAAAKNTLTAMVRLGIGVYAAGGELLMSSEWLKSTDRPFKTATQFIDCDRLATPPDYLYSTTMRIRGGVRQDRFGAPLGYYIRKGHVSDHDFGLDSQSFQYVAAQDKGGRKQILHILEQNRIDQSRGISDIVAGLKELRITKRFRDVTLQQAVIAAHYAASIESDLPPELVQMQMGGGNVGNPGTAAATYAAQYLAAIGTYAKAGGQHAIDGVRIPHFFPGTRLNIKQVGEPGGIGQDFEKSLLRYVAAILNVSYEELSRDYSESNYSSMRAAMTKTWQFMAGRKKLVADKIANFVYQLWFEEMWWSDGLECLKTAKRPDFYDPLMKEAYCQATWIGAGRGQIDELKETQASVLKIKFGLSTYEDELAKEGKDWRKTFAQRQREQQDIEARGLTFQEDNSINAASGTPSEANDGDNSGSKKKNGNQ